MASHHETSGFVPSVGSIGTYARSDERVVTIEDGLIQWLRDLREPIRRTARAMRANDATRGQLKFRAGPQVVGDPKLDPYIEGVLDASNRVQCGIVFMGYNRRGRSGSPVPWDETRTYWLNPRSSSPVERIADVVGRGYTLTTRFSCDDIPRMGEIWRPFGWSEEGIAEWMADYIRGEGGWACGVRGPSGQVEALAKAEPLKLGDTTLVESTEWGTHRDSRTHGLGTAVVIGLNAQILTHPPLTHAWTIFAEARMDNASPSHRLARLAGFEACSDLTSPTPNGVLPGHVSVDGELRDFLLTQLTPGALNTYYPDDVLSYIRSNTHS